jgi:hypothetical protein
MSSHWWRAVIVRFAPRLDDEVRGGNHDASDERGHAGKQHDRGYPQCSMPGTATVGRVAPLARRLIFLQTKTRNDAGHRRDLSQRRTPWSRPRVTHRRTGRTPIRNRRVLRIRDRRRLWLSRFRCRGRDRFFCHGPEMPANSAALFTTRTATCRRSRSAANAGRRSYCPSAQRYSVATFWPTT